MTLNVWPIFLLITDANAITPYHIKSTFYSHIAHANSKHPYKVLHMKIKKCFPITRNIFVHISNASNPGSFWNLGNNKVHCDIVTHFNAKSVLCCCFSNNYCMSQNAHPKKLLNYTTCKTIQARKVGFVWWKKFHFLLVKTCSCLLSPSLCVDERINFASEPQWTFFCFYLQRSAKLVKLFDQVRGLWKVAL